MNKALSKEEIDKIPEDGIDFKDFILQVAHNNNWVFDLSEYMHAISREKRGVIGRVSTTLKELEDDRMVIKRSSGKIYDVTTKGINYYYKKPEIKPSTEVDDKNKAKIDDRIANRTDSMESIQIKDSEYNFIKLNRTAEGIDDVDKIVSNTSKFIAVASGVSTLAIVAQFLFSVYGTTNVHGEISLSQQQQEPTQLRTQLTEATEILDRQSYQLDSLKMVIQKLTKK